MELESGVGAGRVGSWPGRRRVSGVGGWMPWAARGIAVHGQHGARRPQTHDRRHVGDHVDEDAGRDEGV